MNYLGMIGAAQLLVLFVILGIIPTVIALIDILKSKFKDNDRVIWLLIVLFLNILGAILYLVIGRKQKIKN